MLYADTTTTLARLADVIAGNVLLSGGVGTAPTYGKVVLGTHTNRKLCFTDFWNCKSNNLKWKYWRYYSFHSN